ncbi:TGF_BETA_2 domain-containing protein [Caerostris extrusa]|uniref:TGF_BETA_2 domain-containing protein n=1 Tax=Caerostris extrusa TaxID=172846 RepID=A0AAV4PF12_CAEEX|nr:TGF_BETA_2 domain-containing protein [Caerostris extrusa]
MTTLLPLLLVAAMLVLSTTLSKESRKAEKPEDSDPDITRMKELKIQVIKKKILSEINLPEFPVINSPVIVPDHLLDLLREENEKENEFALGQGETLIAYPMNDNTMCRNESECARFEYELSSAGKSVTSINIRIQKKKRMMPIKVMACLSNSLEEDDHPCFYQMTLREVKSEKGWSIYEIPYKVIMESRIEPLFCTVEISGPLMKDYGDKKPFIKANLIPDDAVRQRGVLITTKMVKIILVTNQISI